MTDFKLTITATATKTEFPEDIAVAAAEAVRDFMAESTGEEWTVEKEEV